MSDLRLSMPSAGRMTMERFAQQFVEAPARSISIERCTLRRPSGGFDKHNLAHMVRHMQKVYGDLVDVQFIDGGRESCRIKKV